MLKKFGTSRVLVTGASGFIGSNLVKNLSEKGFDVVAPLRSELNVLSQSQFKFEEIEHVFHLAGTVPAGVETQDPGIMIRSHVLGTLNTLDFARKTGCSVTYVSSFVYGTDTVGEIDEGFPVVRSSPYAASKIMAENLCREFSEAFSVPVAIVRPFNLFGPGQRSNFVVPRIIESMMGDEGVLEMSGSDDYRDFLYVSDLVNLLVRTGSWNGPCSVFNAGSGRAVRISEVIDTVMDLIGKKKQIRFVGNRSAEARRTSSWAGIAKAKREFGWSPTVSLRAGLENLINLQQ